MLQDSCAPSPQIYLIAPGKKMRPKPIDRRFALVRADHLPTLLRQATVASDAQVRIIAPISGRTDAVIWQKF